MVLRYDALIDGGGLARTVFTTGGVLEEETVQVGAHCVTCSLVEQVTTVLPLLAARVGAGAVVLALPVATPTGRVLRALEGAARRRPADRAGPGDHRG